MIQSQRARHWSLLSVVWVGMIVLVNPLGNFPLMDDWAYTVPVLNLLNRGALQLSNWGAPNLFSHVMWGALFAKLFGFSFTVLRFSTLCLGLISIISFYEIFRELKLPPRMGVHAALVLAGSPLFLLLSNTYMSDVSYCAFGLLACLFLIKSLRRDSTRYNLLGLFFACVALLTRQVGLALFIGYACALLVKGPTKRGLISFFGILVLGIAVQKGYEAIMLSYGWLPVAFNSQSIAFSTALAGAPLDTLKVAVKNGTAFFLYLGLFTFPLQLLHALRFVERLPAKRIAQVTGIFCLFFVGFMFYLVQNDLKLPLLPNLISRVGFGPLTLRDAVFFRSEIIYSLPETFWWSVTGTGAAGGFLLAAFFFAAAKRLIDRFYFWQNLRKNTSLVFLVVTLMVSFAPRI